MSDFNCSLSQLIRSRARGGKTVGVLSPTVVCVAITIKLVDNLCPDCFLRVLINFGGFSLDENTV